MKRMRGAAGSAKPHFTLGHVLEPTAVTDADREVSDFLHTLSAWPEKCNYARSVWVSKRCNRVLLVMACCTAASSLHGVANLVLNSSIRNLFILPVDLAHVRAHDLQFQLSTLGNQR
jgi:hypothetical protein